MGGTFIGAAASSSNTGQPVLTYANLGSYASGDILTLIVYHSNTTTVTTPSGYTKIGTGIPAAGSNFAEVYTKTMTGSETGTVTIATTSAGKVNQVAEVWRGVIQPTASEIASSGFQTDTTQSRAVPALSHSGTLNWITSCATRNSTPPTTFTVPSGTTLGASTFTTGSGANCASIAHSNASESDGSVGSGNWQHNTASAVDWTILTIGMVDATTRVTKTGTIQYDVKSRATKTGTIQFDVLSRATKTGTITFDVGQRVTKTGLVQYDVASATTRVTKTGTITYDVAARVTKTGLIQYDVAVAQTRVTKTGTITYDVAQRGTKTGTVQYDVAQRGTKTGLIRYDVVTRIMEASWPAWIGHRGSDPGPEETLFAYDTLWGRGHQYWHEGDMQVLNDGTTMVASHDDTIDRMYSSGPVSTGNISSMTPTQWDATFLRYNTGFTGTEKQAMRITAWNAKYGSNGSAGSPIGLWEVKTGTDVNDCIAVHANNKGSVILNCNSLADAQAAVAAGFEACYQTDTPTFSQFTSNNIHYLSINYTAMTGTIATNAIAAGVKVLMYTVNSTTNRDNMLALFSDTTYAGFISNKPQTIDNGSRVTKNGTITFDVKSRVTKTGTIQFDVLNRVSKNGTIQFDVKQRGTRNGTITFDVYARGTKTGTITYDVATATTRVTKTGTITFDVKTRLTKTGLIQFDVGTNVVYDGHEFLFFL